MPEEGEAHPNGNGNTHTASETSPLLTKIQSSELVSDGTAPEGPLPAPSNGTFDPEQNEEGDGGALHPSISAVDRQKQYEGLPEVKARLKYIFPAIAIGIFMSAADQTIIVSSKEGIGSELKALNMTSWIATAYFLTLTSFQPLYGKLSDIFGRKECLLFGYTVFGLGCLGCGLAQNMEQLIAARAFAGTYDFASLDHLH